MHIAVLMANTDDSAFAQAHPGDGSKFETLLHGLRPDWRVSVYAVKDGKFPAMDAVYDGWIITGSPASVHDSNAWVRQLEALIRRLVAEEQPLFGACFGHQAIAKALGGVVGDNPGGWVFGLVETVMEGVPMRLYAAHREQVLGLPEGAVGLGGGKLRWAILGISLIVVGAIFTYLIRGWMGKRGRVAEAPGEG